jgi:RNA polymerase sigma-70 factor (ECF subfamily)
MEDAGALASDRDVPAGQRDALAGEPDDELALAARSDPAAFGLLYDRHRLAVFRYLRTRTSSADDAADLTAITFERALVAMPRYRPTGGGILAWLLRIARNAAIDAGRRASTVPLVADVPDERHALAPDQIVLAEEARITLAAAVNRLPDLQREAIVLRYAARLSARQIGHVLGKSDQATQKLLSRALETLRESYRVDI